MAYIITAHDVSLIGDEGEVVWLEIDDEDGKDPLLIPYMTDIDICGQKPVLINANDWCIQLDGKEIDEHMREKWGIKKYRWWRGWPSWKEREKNKEEWTRV